MTVKAIPDGMHSLTPHLVCEGDGAAAAIAFYKAAFGAVELMRMPAPSGKLMHAALTIGDSLLMLADAPDDWAACGLEPPRGSSRVTIHLQVQDADAVMARAAAAGAKIVMPVTEMFWGDRYGQLQDPFGQRWALATHVRDVSPQEMQAAAAKMAGG